MRQQTYTPRATPAQPKHSAATTESLPSPQSEGQKPPTARLVGRTPTPGENTMQTDTGKNKDVIRMTMAEWKRIHRDFKGTHIGPDGKRWRSVLRPGGLVAVEIIK